MVMDGNYSVHEFDVVVRIKCKVVVSNPEKQLAKYPNVFIEEIKEDLGYGRTELVSSNVEVLGDQLTLVEARRLMDKETK